MGFQLTIAAGKEAGRQFLFEQEQVTIGRTSDCDIILYDPGVSRKHARIFRDGKEYFVEDMGSSNGTKVNGKVVNKVQLSDGDQVALGAVVFSYVRAETVETQPGPPPDQSTRVVSEQDIRKQRVALVPAGSNAEDLSALSRTRTTSMEAIRRPSGTSNLPPPPERDATDPSPALSAAERARIRREAPKVIAEAKIVWLGASTGARRLTMVLVTLAAIAAVSAAIWKVLAPGAPDLPPEPQELTNVPVAVSFGLGEDVLYEQADMKSFTFDLQMGSHQKIVILQFQSRDIGDGEVIVLLNGAQVGVVPADSGNTSRRWHELLLPLEHLKPGEKNTLAFDNTKNPPESQSWRVWNVSVEDFPLPPKQEIPRLARELVASAQQEYERRQLMPRALYNAWEKYRNAWAMLGAYPELDKDLASRAGADAARLQQELIDACGRLIFMVQQAAKTNAWEAARGNVLQVQEYFPEQHHCIRQLEAVADDLGLR